jgi:hypothetical protein
MTTMNGTTIDEIRAAADQVRDHQLTVIERVASDGTLPFEQKSHDLMIKSVDRIAQEWVAELHRVRENTKIVEQMVIEQVTAVKNALTKLHLLGAQTMREAERGQNVVEQLADELDAMMGQPNPTH